MPSSNTYSRRSFSTQASNYCFQWCCVRVSGRSFSCRCVRQLAATRGAAIGVRQKVSAPEGVIRSTVIRMRESSSSTRRRYLPRAMRSYAIAGCQAGRYLLTCSASPGPRAGPGDPGQVRRCRQLPRVCAEVRGRRGHRVRAGVVRLQCFLQRMDKAASSASGLASPASVQRHAIGPAVHRAECGRLRRRHKRVRKGRQHQQASQLVRAARCRASVPEVLTYGAVISVCDERQQHR